ncbi:hypothetical protein Tco_0819264 [Tanacetum coccineum]|uniref:Uncharacterized protein n=1 Tax=Tanacetum coccineum TaxID=301880 RepID=A0ABQ5A625_9ASTR
MEYGWHITVCLKYSNLNALLVSCLSDYVHLIRSAMENVKDLAKSKAFVFAVLGIILFGAAFGFWLVRKYIISDDGEPICKTKSGSVKRKVYDDYDQKEESLVTSQYTSLTDRRMTAILRLEGLEVGSIQRIQGIGYGVLESSCSLGWGAGGGTTYDILPEYIPHTKSSYGVLTSSGNGVLNLLSFCGLWLRCKGVTKQIIGVVPKGLALRVVLVDLHSKDESGKGFKLEVN